MSDQQDFDEIPFDDFWAEWPRKVSKKNAEKSWAKLKPLQQKLALEDVKKRNRFKAWSSNRKLIPHAATYLNGERWEDDWLSDFKSSDDDTKPNTGPYRAPQPKEPEREVSGAEIRLNSAFRDYVFVGGALPEVDTALKIKNELMREAVPAYREDIDAGTITQARANFEIIDLFLSRCDSAYKRNMRDSVWNWMKKRSAMQKSTATPAA